MRKISIVFNVNHISVHKLALFFQKRKEIHTAFIYGSFAKNRVRPTSDMDIAILITKIPQNDFEYKTKLSLELEHLCGREIDLLILNTASPHIAFRAIKEGKMICQKKNRALWNQFVVRIVQMNEDMEILYRKVGRG